MDITIRPGRYVVAVSGGVDSMALLHLLQGRPDMQLVVAHFDHGIRADSADSREVVCAAAEQYGLPFVFEEGKLGTSASEAIARAARYAFLRRVREQASAEAILTAHHQDDLLETAILNLLRGTGRKGLSSLQSRPGLLRPLLHVPKADIRAYARDQGLTWHEDSTNADTRYLRNYIRCQIMPRFDATARRRLLETLERAAQVNSDIDREIDDVLLRQPSTRQLDRRFFIELPHLTAKEVLAAWLRQLGVPFDAKTLERVAITAKTAVPGTRIDVARGVTISVNRDILALQLNER